MKNIIFGSAVFYLLTAGSAGAENVDINTAPLEDLVKIIHIGEVRALELISLRPFSSLDELTKIKGIGEARIKDIKKQGLAWIAEENNRTAGDGPPRVLSPTAPAELNFIEKTAEKIPPQTEIAAVGESPSLGASPLISIKDGQSFKSSLVFLTAFGLAAFSGAIILLLKKNCDKLRCKI
jgi:hypothetical protein